METLLTEVVNLRDTGCVTAERWRSESTGRGTRRKSIVLTTASEDTIRAAFISQLGGFGLSRFLHGAWLGQ